MVTIWSPISNSVPQFSKNAGGAAAADYYLKFYLSGTTTPTSMATDSTGGTLLDKCKINSLGYPVNGSDEVFIPHIDQAYKLALYTNVTDADNNATGSAAWVVDGLTFVSSPITAVATLIEEQTAASDGQALFTLLSITYTPGAKNLGVYRNGTRLPQSSYTETSSTSITLNASEATSIVTGDEFEFIVNERDVSTATTPASNVTYTPAGTGVATSVAAFLDTQELESMADLVASSIDAGRRVRTIYHTARATGGGAAYLIKTAAQASTDGDTIDEVGNVTLANSNVAILQPENGEVDIRAFGAKCNSNADGVAGDDDAQAWKDATEWAAGNGAKPKIICDGLSKLAAASLANGSGLWGSIGGINLLTGNHIEFRGLGGWVLEPNLEYPQVCVPLGDVDDVTVRGAKVYGNNAYANGLVLAGIGGGVNDRINYYDCVVFDIRSENVISGVNLSRRQGGAAYVTELAGTGGFYNCQAIRCTVARRFSPSPDVSTSIDCVGFYAEDCETVLSTNPSNFDNRDYAQDASYSKFTEPSIRILGDTFKNCGQSTDAMTQLSFVWRDTSPNGLASGNYYPWAGLKLGAAGSTYGYQNWEPATFIVGDSEWSSGATYNDGDRVKVTNNNEMTTLQQPTRRLVLSSEASCVT
jgi:hypothetical protein